MKNRIVIYVTLISIFLFASFATVSVASETSFEEASTNDYLYTRGLISSVSMEERTITVRPAKGPKITVEISDDTLLKGLRSLDELERKQQLKIWYEPAGEKLRALKVEKMMELGC